MATTTKKWERMEVIGQSAGRTVSRRRSPEKQRREGRGGLRTRATEVKPATTRDPLVSACDVSVAILQDKVLARTRLYSQHALLRAATSTSRETADRYETFTNVTVKIRAVHLFVNER